MTKTIEDLFFYGVFVADFFVITQILFFSRLNWKKKVIWLLLLICIINSVSNILSFYLSTKANYLGLVIFTCLEYLIFASIFVLSIKNTKFIRLIYGLSLLFVAFVIWNIGPSNKNIDSLPIGIETILIMIYCFYYLYEQMNDLSDSFIYNRYHFWIAIGILIYLGGSFFIYLFADKAGSKILDDYWFLTYVFYIVKNVFFAIGIANLITQNKKSKTLRIKPYSN